MINPISFIFQQCKMCREEREKSKVNGKISLNKARKRKVSRCLGEERERRNTLEREVRVLMNVISIRFIYEANWRLLSRQRTNDHYLYLI